MMLFPTNELLELVEIYILGELVRTKRVNRFLFVVPDCFIKLTKEILFKRITTISVAHALVYHWVFCYGPLKTVLSNNGSQFMARLFTKFCHIIGTQKSIRLHTTRSVSGR